MATNKRYNPALQKMRLGSASPAAVDPALNSYVLMLLRSMPISGIDTKERPTVRPTTCLSPRTVLLCFHIVSLYVHGHLD